MPKRNLLSLVLLAGLIVLLASPASVLAQENGFTETFDDSSLPGWERHPDATAVVDGVLQINPGGFALHFGDWSEITLTVKVNFAAEAEAVIGYYFRDMGRYILVLADGRLALNKEQDQTRSELGNAEAASLTAGAWHTVKITVTSGQHRVYVGDDLALTATDSDPLETGAFMLRAQGDGIVQFDDLVVRGTPGGGPPPGERPQPAASPADLGAAPVSPAATQPAAAPGNWVDEFFASQASTIELSAFFINLILAAVCAYILGIVYVHWGASLTNRRKFASNFLLMTITTTFIIMVVRSSVALSLGLVGALSIVRFRAAVKEPEELAYLFFALGIGIGLGDNQRLITLVAMAVGIALIGLRHVVRKTDADVNLHVSIAARNPSEVSLEGITAALGKHTAKLKLLRFDETSTAMEAAYLVEFRRADQLTEARAALRALSPSLEITFMDNKGIW
ncbi:MAG: DUF4956 domain-containing protein [Chloroflexota bacterium]